MKKHGFTLFELALVLAIIGLIIAGTVIGRELVRAAELRAIISDVEGFKSQVNTFKLKYAGLPGDLKNATSYLGGTAPNGDGDDKITYNSGAMGEEYYAWAHLTAAGLIGGTYSAASVTNIPTSRVSGGMYRISFQSSVYNKSGHMISINALNTTYGLAHDAILTPLDAYAIDSKMDDGLADSGRVLGFNPEGVPGCVTNYYTSSSGSYILTNTGVLCKMFYLLDF